jgi:hypothetical protein
MSAQVSGKKYATPLPFTHSPHPSPPPYPPPQRQLPRANDIGPLDPVTSSANGVAALAQIIGICSVPFRATVLSDLCKPSRPTLPLGPHLCWIHTGIHFSRQHKRHVRFHHFF